MWQCDRMLDQLHANKFPRNLAVPAASLQTVEAVCPTVGPGRDGLAHLPSLSFEQMNVTTLNTL